MKTRFGWDRFLLFHFHAGHCWDLYHCISPRSFLKYFNFEITTGLHSRTKFNFLEKYSDNYFILFIFQIRGLWRDWDLTAFSGSGFITFGPYIGIQKSGFRKSAGIEILSRCRPVSQNNFSETCIQNIPTVVNANDGLETDVSHYEE